MIIFSCFEMVSFAETNNLLPQASFTANPASGTAPLQVHFDAGGSTAGRGNNIINYEWKFETLGEWESSGISSTIDHTYQNPGAYTIRLRVTNDHNQISLPQPENITLITVTDTEPSPCPDPTASFSFTSAAGDPLNVQFNASTSNAGDEVSINNYLWDFGDGQNETTSDNTITHSYMDFGSYSVSLIVTNSCNHAAFDFPIDHPLLSRPCRSIYHTGII